MIFNIELEGEMNHLCTKDLPKMVRVIDPSSTDPSKTVGGALLELSDVGELKVSVKWHNYDMGALLGLDVDVVFGSETDSITYDEIIKFIGIEWVKN